MAADLAHAGADRGARLRTLAALLGVALYAWLALSSGLDRLADHGDVEVIRLWPFGAGHARAAARSALYANKPVAAREAARDAVRRDPFDAEAIGLLGEAARQSHDMAAANRAFAVGARLGWREPLTQAYWLDASLARGDVHAAADHLDAILRQAPEYAGRNLLLAPFDATLGGRRELAARLALRPAWAQAYFGDTAGPEAGDPLARGEVAELLAGRGLRDCALIAPVIDGLVRHGHRDAVRLRLRHCGGSGAGQGLVPVDGRFALANPAHPPTVLDWHFTSEGAISVAVQPRSGIPGRALVIDNAGSATLAVAEQPLLLPAGDYLISWRARDAAGAPSAAIEVALTCDVAAAPWLAKTLTDPRRASYQARVSVPAGCARQRLVLGIAGDVQGAAAGDVAITAVAGGNAAARLDNARPAG